MQHEITKLKGINDLVLRELERTQKLYRNLKADYMALKDDPPGEDQSPNKGTQRPHNLIYKNRKRRMERNQNKNKCKSIQSNEQISNSPH